MDGYWEYRLRKGDLGPTQQWPISCGAACLTVARMLVDPVFSAWMHTGSPRLPGSPEGASMDERFAAYERIVLDRTNRVLGHRGRPTLPWPQRLGTPPWGAKVELERGAARAGTRYEVVWLPRSDRGALVAAYDRLVDVVAEGEPGILYIGSPSLPRHLVLVLPGDGDRTLDVYDPAGGRVSHLRRDDFAHHRLSLSGWDTPHIVIQPTGLRRMRVVGWVRDRVGRRVTDPFPAAG